VARRCWRYSFTWRRARALERWLIGHTGELAAAGIDLTQLRADNARLGPGLERAGTKLFNDWLDQAA